MSVQVFLCEGGRINDCIEKKSIVIMLCRRKKAKIDIVYVIYFLINPTNSHPLPFPAPFIFLHRDLSVEFNRY